MAFNQDVRGEWDTRDRYGRVVGKVRGASLDGRYQHTACPTTLDVGLVQITQGLVWHYRRYAPGQSEEDRTQYAFAETEARAKRVGLWRDWEPVAP